VGSAIPIRPQRRRNTDIVHSYSALLYSRRTSLNQTAKRARHSIGKYGSNRETRLDELERSILDMIEPEDEHLGNESEYRYPSLV
jgi:hypothetical protein